jgi:predicted TIM-barrel enzyme
MTIESIPERSFTRSEILGRLGETLTAGQPIVGVAAGVGIVAKCAEIAGTDLIFVHANSRSRNQGVPTSIYIGNPIDLTLDMYPEIDNVVDRTPVIAGIDATDGQRRRLSPVIDEYLRRGVNGITNFPTALAYTGNWGRARNDVGMGSDRELELLALARERDVFTVGQSYDASFAKELAAAGADVIVARCGLTQGGMVGPSPQAASSLSLAEATEHVQAVVEAAREANPEVFVLAHGGPFARPADTDHLYAHSDVQGILAESAIERIPVEDYVAAEIASFKSPVLRSVTPAR